MLQKLHVPSPFEPTSPSGKEMFAKPFVQQNLDVSKRRKNQVNLYAIHSLSQFRTKPCNSILSDLKISIRLRAKMKGTVWEDGWCNCLVQFVGDWIAYGGFTFDFKKSTGMRWKRVRRIRYRTRLMRTHKTEILSPALFGPSSWWGTL